MTDGGMFLQIHWKNITGNLFPLPLMDSPLGIDQTQSLGHGLVLRTTLNLLPSLCLNQIVLLAD